MLDGIRKAAGAVTAERAQEMIREFNDAVPTIKGLGLSVRNLSFKMGVPPEIGATFIGSVEALDQGTIKDLMERYEKNSTIKLILETLRAVSNLKDQLTELDFKGIKADVKLGLLPSVEVGLLVKTDIAEAS
jgi:predicted regulator of amino acid metabolism with ACT domain